ncbi:hypothetical protein TNCT_415431 [Trichonephila clavata]|uniref:Uncharacterized protein n=1 Tax=Trichonephila clavata TaxID=2740835 RepID=A0A8X6G900_TRICU|nr:hypothetical protein TNCT_415431 [Trichonephila clavata]
MEMRGNINEELDCASAVAGEIGTVHSKCSKYKNFSIKKENNIELPTQIYQMKKLEEIEFIICCSHI